MNITLNIGLFQHAAARRRLRERTARTASDRYVSTRSRPKAADQRYGLDCRIFERFNTQPPEGG